METEKVLLVGGSNDGDWIAKPMHHRIRLREKQKTKTSWVTGCVCKEIAFPIEHYESHRFQAGDSEWQIYVLVGLPIETAFQKLLDGYHPSTQDT